MAISKGATYQAGDVVVVPFPYTDRFAEKRRPALVVSSALLQAQGFVWVAMITSAKSGTLKHDLPISDLGLAGLPAESVVRPIKLACLEPSRILRCAGRLGENQSKQALAAVAAFLG